MCACVRACIRACMRVRMFKLLVVHVTHFLCSQLLRDTQVLAWCVHIRGSHPGTRRACEPTRTCSLASSDDPPACKAERCPHKPQGRSARLLRAHQRAPGPPQRLGQHGGQEQARSFTQHSRRDAALPASVCKLAGGARLHLLAGVWGSGLVCVRRGRRERWCLRCWVLSC